MKIVIIGDTASWKSTFGEKLSKKINTKIYHTDLIRIDKNWNISWNNLVKNCIHDILKNKKWIIEGNALRADPTERFIQADIIYLFDFPKVYTLINVIKRWWEIKYWRTERKWFHDNKQSKDLRFNYYIPYIFKNFPKRKRKLKILLKKLNKEIIIVKSYKEINKFLELAQ